ncbi:MAG: signal peptidase I [Acidobacteria bacterium]|nr:signal peptidase I [Acidobacteriota bacterium]
MDDQDTKASGPNETRSNKKKREQSFVRELFELIAETSIFVFFVITFVVQAFQIPTGSMEPTLLIGDFLLVNKMAYSPSPSLPEKSLQPRKPLERYDIVVFKFPDDLSKDFVKRVIALEGETVEIRDKQVYINDHPVPEEYKVHSDSQVFTENEYYQYDDVIRDNYGPQVVPPGYCFVMGDNRDNSMDSRYWGFLPLENIKGRPWLIYFSYEAERDAWQKNSLRDRFKKLLSFIPKARWGRVLKNIK